MPSTSPVQATVEDTEQLPAISLLVAGSAIPRPAFTLPLSPESPLKDTPAIFNAPPAVAAASVGQTRELFDNPEQLTEAEVRQVLADAGTPIEWVDALVRISWCESRWSPGALGDSGNSVGMWQIGRSRPGWQGWFLYFGEDESRALDPHVNARVAVAIARYSVTRGQSPFAQWSCQP